MRKKHSLEGTAVFVCVAEMGGFSRAARQLGISPSAASQAIRSLEAQLGTPLLRRSTRSLSLTDAGADFLRAAAPALLQLRQAAEDAVGRAGLPAGRLRLTMPRAAFDLVVAPLLPAFQDAYPRVEVEIVVEGRMIDIVEDGFDAGLRYGDLLAKDVIAVVVAPASEAVLTAAPAYLATRAKPAHPDDLLDHRSVMCRSQTTGQVKPWLLSSAGETVRIAPPAPTVVHDLQSEIQLIVAGIGIGCAPISSLTAQFATGAILRILPDWSTPLEALHLYFPSRRQSAPLRAFMDFLKARRTVNATLQSEQNFDRCKSDDN